MSAVASEATQDLPMPGYVGIDLSPEAVRRTKIGRPEGEFLVGRLADFPIRADLTICLDVLIHQSDAATYRDQNTWPHWQAVTVHFHNCGWRVRVDRSHSRRPPLLERARVTEVRASVGTQQC